MIKIFGNNTRIVSMNISVEFNGRKIKLRLEGLRDACEDMEDAMDELGRMMLNETDVNFEKGGRYKKEGSHEGGSKKWKPLNPKYRAWKLSHKPAYSGEILQKTGRLRQSFSYDADKKSMAFGTNVKEKGVSYPEILHKERPFIVVHDSMMEKWESFVREKLEKV